VAQTKSKSNARRSSSSSGRSRSTSSKSNGSSGARAKAQAKTKARGKSAPASNGVADSVKRGAKGVPPLARKAKFPLLASGAALVGVAGAIAATHSGKRHKVLGISMPKTNGIKPDARKVSETVVDAAERADRFGRGVSRVASSVRDVGETANKVAKKA
jgi:hypothetical protein